MEPSESYKNGKLVQTGDVNRSLLTIDHMMKTQEYGLLIYDNLQDSLKRNHPEAYRGMLGFALGHHDLTKSIAYGWTDNLLLGTRHPTKEEWEKVIIPHPEKSAEKVGELLVRNCEDDISILTICNIVRLHHVRFDGKYIMEVNEIGNEGIPEPRYGGYPGGYDGSNTPIGAMIAKLADAFEARYSKRNYRSEEENGKSLIHILDHIKERAGFEYWPEAVEALTKIPLEFLEQIQAQNVWDNQVVSRLKTSMN